MCIFLSGAHTPGQREIRTFLQNNTTLSLNVQVEGKGALVYHLPPGESLSLLAFLGGGNSKSPREMKLLVQVKDHKKSLAQVIGQKMIPPYISAKDTQYYFGKNNWKSFDQPFQHKWRVGERTVWLRGGGRVGLEDHQIEYVFEEDYRPAPTGKKGFSVLAYNIYMRPELAFQNGQFSRAGLLPEYLKGYDAIVLCEVFDWSARKRLFNGLAKEYPYRTKMVGQSRLMLIQNGGVVIFSRHPIEAEDQCIFSSFAGFDSLAEKGAIYARINKQGRKYHVFGTHLQAGGGEKKKRIRFQQIKEMAALVKKQKISASEAVILAGDFNITYGTSSYRKLLQVLQLKNPIQRKGHLYTADNWTNDFRNKARRRSWIDYVFYSAVHLQPKSSLVRGQILRTRKRWQRFFWETPSQWDLSDHYPILGQFDFP